MTSALISRSEIELIKSKASTNEEAFLLIDTVMIERARKDFYAFRQYIHLKINGDGFRRMLQKT